MVSILIGSTSDKPILEKSGLFDLLQKFDIEFEFLVISSDRNPEELRNYCKKREKQLQLVIAIAGGVPNLPITVKSWLPNIPVISIPIDDNPAFALAALTTPTDRPVIILGYGVNGLQKAAYTARDILLKLPSS